MPKTNATNSQGLEIILLLNFRLMPLSEKEDYDVP